MSSSSPQIIRSHDLFYLNENRYKNTKDSFKQVAHYISANYNANEAFSLGDWGCANGEFLFHINQCFPNAQLTGFDFLPQLLEKAARELPAAQFVEASVLDKFSCEEKTFNVSTLLGVMSIFDNFETVIDNLIYWTKPGGKIYIHNMFNPHPVDVNIKYNISENWGSGILESGWNIFSQHTVGKFLKSRDKNYRFHPFSISVDLSKNIDDPLRSWTETNTDGNRIITNGLCIMQPQYILEITV